MTTFSTNSFASAGNDRLRKIVERVKAESKTIEFRIMAVMLTALMLWAAAIFTFGYPALIVVALALVPVIFTLLMMITVGK